jgi:hypothetical protein
MTLNGSVEWQCRPAGLVEPGGHGLELGAGAAGDGPANRRLSLGAHLGFGRIAISEIEAPDMLANLV